MISLTYRFYVEIDAPAGTDCEERTISREFDTDSIEHALELAERVIDEVLPARVIPGTLNIA